MAPAGVRLDYELQPLGWAGVSTALGPLVFQVDRVGTFMLQMIDLEAVVVLAVLDLPLALALLRHRILLRLENPGYPHLRLFRISATYPGPVVPLLVHEPGIQLHQPRRAQSWT